MKAAPLLDASPRKFLLPGGYALLLVGLFRQALVYMAGVWNSVDYSYCYLIPFITIYLIRQKWSTLTALEPSPSWKGFMPLFAGVILYWLGELGGEYFSLFMASWLIVVGLVCLHLGWPYIREAGAAALVSIAMFPLPNFIHATLSIKLQMLSSRIGVAIIRLVGFTAYREGNVISLGDAKLQVVDACNGLRYLTPLIVLGVVIAHFFKGPWWKRLALVASTIPLAILLNGVRIGGSGIAANVWGMEVVDGLSHDAVGWTVFMVSLGILLAETRLLKGRAPSALDADEIAPPQGSLAQAELIPRNAPSPSGASAPGTLLSARSVVAMLLLGGSLVLSHGIELHPATQIIRPLSELPLYVGEYEGIRKRMDQETVDALHFTDYAMVQYFDKQNRVIDFYVAYYARQQKGESIHSPASCLPANGWVFDDAGTVAFSVQGYGDGDFRVSRALMRKGGAQQIVYYWFPQRGRVLNDLFQLKYWTFRDAIMRRRMDGSLVRLVSPVEEGESAQDVERRLQDFTRIIVPVLDGFLPGEKLPAQRGASR